MKSARRWTNEQAPTVAATNGAVRVLLEQIAGETGSLG
jgi:hypothetical protein